MKSEKEIKYLLKEVQTTNIIMEEKFGNKCKFCAVQSISDIIYLRNNHKTYG